jgi:hypothetical protein
MLCTLIVHVTLASLLCINFNKVDRVHHFDAESRFQPPFIKRQGDSFGHDIAHIH